MVQAAQDGSTRIRDNLALDLNRGEEVELVIVICYDLQEPQLKRIFLAKEQCELQPKYHDSEHEEHTMWRRKED